jgi:hypothetical protein
MIVAHNNLIGGVYAIKGPTVGHNADSVLVSGNQFTKQASASIIDPGGQKWTITGNDFEPLTGANGPMVCIISSHAMGSLTVTHNWFGDGGTDNIAIFPAHRRLGGRHRRQLRWRRGRGSGGGKSHYFLTQFSRSHQWSHHHEQLHLRQHREILSSSTHSHQRASWLNTTGSRPTS